MTTPRLTRGQWGAIRVDPDRPTRVASTRGTALHWVGPKVWGTLGSAGRHHLCAGKFQGIQRTHMAGEYYDIAYSEGVCPHGTRYELRGHHVQVGANGSAAGNRSHYAILALVGEGDVITAELIAGIYDAFEDYRRNAHAGTDTTTHRAILKANTGRTTECPGDRFAELEGAGRFMHRTTPTPAPTPTPPPAPPEDEMQLSDRVPARNYGETQVGDISVSTALSRASWAYQETLELRKNIASIQATLATLAAAAGTGLDPERAEAIFREEAAKRLDELSVTDAGGPVPPA